MSEDSKLINLKSINQKYNAHISSLEKDLRKAKNQNKRLSKEISVLQSENLKLKRALQEHKKLLRIEKKN